MKKQIAILVLVLFTLFCTAAYATETATGSIYGVWENTELRFEFHLNADGTGYTVSSGIAGEMMTIEYGENQLTATGDDPDGGKVTEIIPYVLDGNTLTLLSDTLVTYDADGNETDRTTQVLNVTLVRKANAGSLLGFWVNEEQQIELHLNVDGTAYTVLQGEKGMVCVLEYDDQQFTVSDVEDGIVQASEIFEYTLDGDALTIPKETVIYYDENGTEARRGEIELNLVFTRKTEGTAKGDGLCGAWVNEEQQIELHLNEDGTAYTVLQGETNPPQVFEYDDHQFAVYAIENGNIEAAELFNYTLDGNTLNIQGETMIYYDENGNEISRSTSEFTLTLTRK